MNNPDQTYIIIIVLFALIFLLYSTSEKQTESFLPASVRGQEQLISAFSSGSNISAENAIVNIATPNTFMSTKLITGNLTSSTITAEEMSQIKLISNVVTSPKTTISKLCLSKTNCIDKNAYSFLTLKNHPLNYSMYLPDQCIIWDDLSKQINTGFAAQSGSTMNMTHNINRYGSKHIYTINNDANNSNTGIVVTVPQVLSSMKLFGTIDFNVLWIRVLINGNNGFMISNTKFRCGGSSGYRQTNNMSPDGGIPKENVASGSDNHEWVPIPIILDSTRKITISRWFSDNGLWISGFAFSSNPWNHYRVSALMLQWNLTTTSPSTTPPSGTSWSNDWNNDEFFAVVGQQLSVPIPIINSGKNKIFYIIVHNNTWNELVQSVTISTANGSVTIPMKTTLDNPFSRHYNSKKRWQRYMGGIIESSLLDSSGFINVTFVLPQSTGLYLREVGTHDVNPFDV